MTRRTLHFVRFERKLADLWIGLFWKRERLCESSGINYHFLHVWICFVPCFPLHACWRVAHA